MLAQRGPRELSPVKCPRAGLAAAQGGSAAAQPAAEGSFIWQAGREPAAALGLPAGLGIPHAPATLANVSKYQEVVVGGGASIILFAGCLSSSKAANTERCRSGRTSVHGDEAGKSDPASLRAGAQTKLYTLSSSSLQLSLCPSQSGLFCCSFLSTFFSPSSLPVKFHSPFIPGKTELEGFENHFKRQPSPIFFPMAYGDNNSAAAPDLLASITLQDQLIPVKITYVTEE